MRGIVAFSFAQRSEECEPGPCNLRLAEAVALVAQGVEQTEVMIVAQWEVARGLADMGVHSDKVVSPSPGAYLDSETVWRVAAEEFKRRGITEVTPVAQKFLHLAKVANLIKKDGFEVAKENYDSIGFDPSSDNLQWWTRGPVRLVAYSFLQLIIGKRGPMRLHSQ